ncbi:hypothetical protein NQZ68_029543 [Dissostichus eleginoides]|nr:hypothetical protein NQZ68_029543 [Dissostichus eleginoides]
MDLNLSRATKDTIQILEEIGVRILCFLSFGSGLHPEDTQAVAGNSPDMQAKKKQSAVGVVSSFSFLSRAANHPRQRSMRVRSQTQIRLRRYGATFQLTLQS